MAPSACTARAPKAWRSCAPSLTSSGAIASTSSCTRRSEKRGDASVTAEARTEPIVHERQIDASPETVFAFFTEPEKLTRWLAAEATLDPRPGGACWQTHAVRDGDPYLMRGEFV